MRRQRRHHRTAPRTTRLLGSLLLVAAVGALTVGASPVGADPARAHHGRGPADPVPLDRVIPAPASVAPGGSPYRITEHTRIRVDGSREARRVGEYLADVLRPSTGYRLPVTEHGGGGIRLRLAKGPYGAEGYRLDSGRSGVTLTAAEPAGLFHGVQTLRQLLPAAVEKDTVQRGPWLVAGGTIEDTPRYAWRGAMLDVSRHFFGVDEVKRYIDQLALYKINKLHLHLSDDQGWRIAVDSWPRLTTHGGSTEVGGGPGGHYTKADYREIVRHAAARHLEVVPEIDMPGHTNAALASYAELNCDGVAPPLYTGTEVGFSSLCVGKEVTYDFVDDVVRELAALTPGRYLHIGGDEAHSTPHEDYVEFMDRVQPIVAEYGKTVIGWHQLTGANPAEGALAQYWGLDGTGAREKEQVAEAARNGTGLILSPADRSYLDMKYDEDTPLGLSWAGYVEVRRSYDWDPGAYLEGVPASAVRGVEAPLWTETLENSAHLEYMAFPRLPGVAELGWSPAATHDWEDYRVRLAEQGPRWDAMGIGYHKSPQVPWPAA
ncbi:beta-N-acetylhexosaminidase [Streptomyces griseomycini]|uniref:beta-N-acetylhexosaminidase n=1 Tax=Streptomyces griseomycini TaxID=66895 RepID=A0A7W7PTG5_9ACTN|nr:beta-N-acetylhexosaminidase [Streptomyces griseomycini]MBB4900998.1 hexosaminidase [Streptomyces griseomycini]GGP87837.1 beta-N-acetylhexosaminidase [Streptomyces griseomycini]GGR16142.1 beta-N-acetylhexosaminidase [Streptomyces griseomycini]